MRPDEHKKKKNDAYKRKHGITSGSNTGRSKDKDPAFGGDFKQKGKNKQNSANEKSDGKNEQTSKLDKRLETKVKDLERFHDEIKVLSTSSSSESEKKADDGVKAKKKTYRKRQIVSNWQKYEIEPDVEGEAVTSRGENFDKLVGMAGKALSHFRFKDELEWERNTNTDDIKSVSQILNIDSAQLGQHLSCIPVHNLLGISPEVFTASQLEEIIADAKKNEMTYFPSFCDQGAAHENTILPHKNNQLRINTKDSPNLARDQLIILHETLEVKQTTENHGDPSLSLNLKSSCSDKKQYDYDLSLKDEDLDLLIGVDSDERNNGTSKDEYQSLDSKKTLNTKTPVVVSKEDENLEDWLDSVLDD